MSSSIQLIRSNPMLRWAAGGWIFFIAENAILSENRNWIIDELGDENYHLVYGTLSTIATASIGYSYYSIRKAMTTLGSTSSSSVSPLILWKTRPPLAMGVASWTVTSIGLIMASQVAPKLQIPVEITGFSSGTVGPQDGGSTGGGGGSSSVGLKVRCPFDFTDKRAQDSSSQLYGLERITRHPGLWSFGLIGLGQSFVAASLPQRIWWTGPAAVAWLGGSHTDSRFRRGMGGTLNPEYDCQTSNVPFWAMICGKQGSGSWNKLMDEVKPLNALVAVGISTLMVLRKMR